MQNFVLLSRRADGTDRSQIHLECESQTEIFDAFSKFKIDPEFYEKAIYRRMVHPTTKTLTTHIIDELNKEIFQ